MWSENFFHDSRIIDATNYYELNSESRGPSSLSRLEDRVIPSAFHDFGERVSTLTCHPDTRGAVLQRIETWSKKGSRRHSKRILWLYGPAGSGKSAIARTIAEMLRENDALAGAFFFSRVDDRRNLRRYLIPTLAYQLLHALPDIRPYVAQVIQDDSFIFDKSLETQLNQLIIRPIQTSYTGYSGRPLVLIIDGLDECSGEEDQRKIISVFEEQLRQLNFPLHLLVVSRPEKAVRGMFELDRFNATAQLLNLDEAPNKNEDIEQVLQSGFTDIKRHRAIHEKAWPGEHAIQSIVRRSSGQFIYASDVLEFVGAPQCNPREQLDIILGLRPPSRHYPFLQLDALFSQILASISEASIEVAFDVFAYLLVSPRDLSETITNSTPSPRGNIQAIEDVLFMDFQSIRDHLVDLHSILSVPLGSFSSSSSVKFYHASFTDYLTDPSRSGEFCLARKTASARISRCLFKRVLAAMVCPVAEKTWLDRPRLREETFWCLSNASPDPELERLLRVMLKFKGKEFHRLLQTTLPDTTMGVEARRTLFDVLHDCDYKMEILRYLKHCHLHFQTGPLCRLVANWRLIPGYTRTLRGLASCRSHLCTKHFNPAR